jgi:hypothetical protein
MSRPQFSQNNNNQQQLLAHQPVVNGGLIDFQDNFNRGMCEYPTPQQLMAAAYGYQQQQGAVSSSMMAPNQAAALSALCQHYQQQGVAAGFPSLNPPGSVAGMPGGLPSSSSMMPATTAASGGSAVGGGGGSLPGTYISGPPTFLHVNGVTYKPVEEAPVPTTSANSNNNTKSAAAQEIDSDRVGTKMLTEKDLHLAIDQRVQSKVESYLSTRRYPTSPNSNSTSSGVNSGYHPRSSPSPPASTRHSHSKGGNHMDAEERAAARVQNVNASMKGGRNREGAILRDW